MWALVASEYLAPPFWNPKYATDSMYHGGIAYECSSPFPMMFLGYIEKLKKFHKKLNPEIHLPLF